MAYKPDRCADQQQWLTNLINQEKKWDTRQKPDIPLSIIVFERYFANDSSLG
jgi:hypothetical protein